MRRCYYKNRYPTMDLAVRAQEAAQRDRGTATRIYHCGGGSGCDGFHLTAQDAEPLKPGWRPAKKSQRDRAYEQKRERARRRR